MSILTATAVPHVRLLRGATSLLVFLFTLTVSSLSAQTGRIEGTVTSQATGNALQGARVTLTGSSQFVLSDGSGRFVLFNVPAGAAQITASYSGFEDLAQSVQVAAGAQTQVSLVLASSDTLQLEKFTVNSVKEGQALAVTEQRNAPNVKNVVAMDEWGVLPTQNVAELLTRMPGVTASVDEDNLMNYVSIRGQPNTFTTLNIDGMSSTGVSAFGRAPSFHSFSASTIEQIELILGQTPDRRADSLGGTVNLKTRSPLAMSGKRRIDYTLAGSWAASWGDRNVPLKDHPFGPDLSVTYTEIFDVFGGKRNLGITATASYQEIVRSFDFDRMLYENTTNTLAQLRDYTRVSGLNQRFLEAFNLRADYRWRDHTTVSARFLYNAGDEPNFNYTWVNPWFSTNATVYDPVTNPAGAVMPGYTTNRTEVRPSGNTQMLLTPQHYAFTSRNPTGTFTAEHNFGRLKIEEAIRWSNTVWNSTAGRDQEGGILTLRTAPLGSIGFILDTTDLTGQVFTQTAGPSVYNAANYASVLSSAANTTTQPVAQTSTSLVKRDAENRTNEVSAYINFSYTLDTKFPITLKTGFDTQNKRVNLFNKNPQRYYAVVGSVLSGELMPLTEFERQNAPAGSRLPVFNPDNIDVTNTAVWYQDVNYTATQRYTTRRLFEEGVDAAFLMGDAKFGKLRVIGGVRSEWVKTETFTYFRARSTPIAVEPDHFKRAAMDFQAQTADGSYDKLFPSIQFAYDVTRNLVARASWSTSYGRPTYQQLIPAVTVSDANQTVTIGNASIKPQMAKNIDLKLEYYFKDSGVFTVSVYQKDITDLIGGNVNSGETVPVTPDNGFDGLYGGYAILLPTNIGNAEVQGVEFDYRQRLTFLPGALKGLSVRANYAKLKAKGVYNGATELTTNQVAGFVPENANFSLGYSYKKLGITYDLSYRSGYPSAVSLTSPGNGNLFYRALVTHNLSFEYRLRPNVTLFTTANNFTGNGPEIYTYLSNRPRQLLIAPTFVKFGVRGQF